MIRIYQYGETEDAQLFARNEAKADVASAVSEIIENVKTNGDSALLEYCEKFDKVRLSSLEVSAEEIDAAMQAVDDEVIRVMKRSAKNICAFHQKQIRSSFVMQETNGVVMGQRILPIERVGIYVPGGTAPLSSSVLMNAIPAKLAGCKTVVMVTPPSKDGRVHPSILAAAKIAGVDRIFKVGGAQAVAALAYGTETVPAVDKIVGPGNAFVAEAKKQVFGKVAIDMIAGPSDILVVADATCNPEIVAADLLSQAEHDKLATSILVTDCAPLAYAVSDALERQITKLPRFAIARASIDNNGKIIITKNLSQAIEIANKIAPEHLELCVDQPFDYLADIRHAGSVFLGKNCPEALGDYLAGPNHTLPTGGTARFSSPLSVDDFVKKSQFTYYTAQALEAVAEDVALFATQEELTAHAASALSRSTKKL